MGTIGDRFETRRANFIDGCAGYIESDSSSNCNLSGWSLPNARSQHVSEDNFVNFLGVKIDGVDGSFDCELTQFDCME